MTTPKKPSIQELLENARLLGYKKIYLNPKNKLHSSSKRKQNKMNNNRDLSKILESLQDLQKNTASTEEITVLREMLSETISTVIVLAQQTSVISKAMNKRITLVDEKVNLNREAIDRLYKHVLKEDKK